ncbi:MAG: tetratricopeptide repeat protein, partial [Caldithrix sp.]|nr:tetratricopeptide repeat protein [Caldithrix sp.]
IDYNNYFNFLQQTYFEKEGRAYNTMLMDEFVDFIRTYPDADQLEQVFWMMAEIRSQEGHYGHALAGYLKILFYKPQSEFRTQVQEKILELCRIHPGITLAEEKIKNTMQQNLSFKNRRQGLFQFLSTVFAYNDSLLHEPLLHEIDLYLDMYRDQPNRAEILYYWQGQILESMQRWPEAYLHYSKLLTLYPNSELYIAAQLRRSILQYRHFGKLEQSVDNLLMIINSAEEDRLAGTAQFHLARIYADSLKSLSEAVNNYKLFVDAFPQHPLHARAVWETAALSQQNGKNEQAVAYYLKYLEQYPQNPRIVAALDNAVTLLSKTLNAHQRAIEVSLRFVSNHNENEAAPRILYRAAKMAKNQANDRKKCQEICRLLIENYGQSAYADQAKSLVD